MLQLFLLCSVVWGHTLLHMAESQVGQWSIPVEFSQSAKDAWDSLILEEYSAVGLKVVGSKVEVDTTLAHSNNDADGLNFLKAYFKKTENTCAYAFLFTHGWGIAFTLAHEATNVNIKMKCVSDTDKLFRDLHFKFTHFLIEKSKDWDEAMDYMDKYANTAAESQVGQWSMPVELSQAAKGAWNSLVLGDHSAVGLKVVGSKVEVDTTLAYSYNDADGLNFLKSYFKTTKNTCAYAFLLTHGWGIAFTLAHKATHVNIKMKCLSDADYLFSNLPAIFDYFLIEKSQDWDHAMDYMDKNANTATEIQIGRASENNQTFNVLVLGLECITVALLGYGLARYNNKKMY